MQTIWYIIIGFLIGLVACYLFYKHFLKSTRSTGSGQVSAGAPAKPNNLIETQAAQKAAHKQQILEMMRGQNRITNNHIQKALDVSAATVVRYLDELEKEGYLREVGLTGSPVYYEKRGGENTSTR